MILSLLLLLLGLVMPLLLTALSTRVKGSAKVGWCIVVLCMSWIGYGIFIMLNPSIGAKQA
ncbi:hypothetical protein HR45_13370 [Shewanella mangrovi]|uniref:Cardiolipin synthase N-terminal domain-containing protein n=1 Tax=Shewanella mangrovi TaxID=1515746 RepID=A0A094JCQ4_9GAMM|nr:hypothetical protein [Shewanella mangrovi]KFZ37027.1 hypothetical protein HR45_13370 [Shewanella mangrovi]